MMPKKQIKPEMPAARDKIKIGFADENDVFSESRLYNLPLSLIEPSPFDSQAERRTRFTDEKLLELGESIHLNGLIEPITVRERRRGDGTRFFEIVCGERRWLASRLKELKSINCFIRDLTDSQTLILQYEENHQQQPSHPMDDALTFKLLHEKEGLSEQEIADRLGTIRQTVVNKLKLNDLIPAAVEELEAGSLPLRHAYYLAKFPAATQREIVREKYAYKYNDADEKAVGFDEFKREVEASVVRRLQDAPFDVNDERLHIKGLTCPNCPESTAFERHLFPDLAKDDSCLNSVCFRLKTDTHLKLKRMEIAADSPNYADENIEQRTFRVPLVTSSSYAPERSVFGKEKVLTSVVPIPAPECRFSELGLAVGGEMKGKQVYLCREKNCPVHDPRPPETNQEEVNRREKILKSEVDKSVRRQVLQAATGWFDDYKPFWQFDDLIKDLIFVFLKTTQFTHDKDFLFFIRDWKDAPKDYTDKAKLRVFVDGLDKRRQSQLLFLMAKFGEMPASRSGNEDETEIRAIAAGYTKLDYDRLTEEIRETIK